MENISQIIVALVKGNGIHNIIMNKINLLKHKLNWTLWNYAMNQGRASPYANLRQPNFPACINPIPRRPRNYTLESNWRWKRHLCIGCAGGCENKRLD